MIVLLISACVKKSKYEGVPFTEKEPRDWENPEMFRLNREDPHSTLVSFPDEQSALEGIYSKSPDYITLDGTWRFNYANSPGERPFWFFKDDYDISDWKDIKVPSNWQMLGYDVPIYVNITYPFKMDPPKIPHDWNPVGSYKRSFNIPSGWEDKEVFLQFGAVSSAFYVWVNEKLVGYSEDSKVPAEFNISGYIRKGKNTVAVEVYRWSDGSYLEDQDFWRLSGIQRSVFLHARPKTFIRDFFAKGDLDNGYKDGVLGVDVNLKSASAGRKDYKVEASLFNGNQKLFTESKEAGMSDSALTVKFNKTIPDVNKWSAEKPNLYTLVLCLKDGEGKPLEYISSKIGFRKVEIINSQLLVNGVAIIPKGYQPS